MRALEQARLEVEQANSEERGKLQEKVATLEQRFAEYKEATQRAISNAQKTKLGYVYIISNIGSFGDNVYKIGLTRRDRPEDRIDELGDSSVPFDFDVHALIKSEDAPKLETQLHRHFVEMQMNKVNYRREFFRVDLQHIREEIQKLGIEAKWTMTAEATQYRETLAIEQDPAKREAWINRRLKLDLLDGAAAGVDDAPEQEVSASPSEPYPN